MINAKKVQKDGDFVDRKASGDVISSSSSLPDDLTSEILSRLPARLLMRFLSVSKHWYSIIRDPSFAKKHRSRLSKSSSLFLIAVEYNSSICYYSCLLSTPESLLNRQSVRSFTYPGVTEVVDGLFCSYNLDCPSLHNLSTAEARILPFSNSLKRRGSPYDFHFGFDPIENKFKLLHTGFDRKCEILTFAGLTSSWRSIGPAPFSFLCQSKCINGTLYWMEPEGFYNPNQKLIAFNLKTEAFKEINPPKTMEFLDRHDRYRLAQIEGHLALARPILRPKPRKLDLWILDDDEGSSKMWTNYLIDFPSELCQHKCYFPIGSLPTGEILLSTQSYEHVVTAFSYNHITGKFQKMSKDNFPSYIPIFLLEKIIGISYYEENIIPLSYLIEGK